MKRANRELDDYFEKAERWRREMEALRKILLQSELIEERKWEKAFYTFGKSNVAVIWSFKAHCALGFCKGTLLKDSSKILRNIGENSQAARKIPFTSVEEIIQLEPVLKNYIEEAIAVEKAGLKVTYKKISEFPVPDELKRVMDEDALFKAAFTKLTPGRQRAYYLYISAPKQSETRQSRVQKCRPRILAGKGLTDRPAR